MKREWGLIVAALASALVSACVNDHGGGSDVVSRVMQAQPSQEDLQAQVVTRGIALALRDPKLRMGLREAFRASPFTEHKLVLQEFARTAVGNTLLNAAASALDLTPSEFLSSIDAFPPLDFYVASQEHRRNWKGNGALLVGAAMGASRAEISAFGPGGNAVRVTQSNWRCS